MEVVIHEQGIAVACGDAFSRVAGAQGGDTEIVAVEGNIDGAGEMPGQGLA